MSRLFLAPMEGVADYVLRDMLTSTGGFDGCVSEFVRVTGSLLPDRVYEDIASGRFKRLPVRDYLLKQGRFAHFIEEDIEYFQSKIDEMWNKWLVPGIIPLQKEIEAE